MTRWLPDIWCCNSVFNSPDTNMLISWHYYVYTWHLIPNTWYLTLVLDMLSLNTWSSIPETWHLIIDMLSLDTWHMLSPHTNTFDLILWHLIGYYYTWYLYYIAYHDYHFYRDLDMIIILLSDIWYSWTPVSPLLMSYALLLLLIARSYQVRQSMPGVGMTRMYPTIMLASGGSWMELSTTRSKLPRHICGGGHLLNLWGSPLESIPHTEQSVTWS